MNFQSHKIEEFLTELLSEQVSLSQKVKTSQNEQETLKNIKDVNLIISLVYNLKHTMEKQKEKQKTTTKNKSK